jgi:putative aldouronate transport system substrate-binding protein
MQKNLFSDLFETKMRMSDHLWTSTDNFHSAGTAISANCKNPQQAMKVLELVNTDPFVATAMRFGIEGSQWTYDESGEMTFDGTLNADVANRSYYFWYNAPVGNLSIVKAPSDLVGPDNLLMTSMVEYNKAALLPPHMGFVFDPTPVTNQVAAVSSVVTEYQKELTLGQLSSQDEVVEMVEEFREKLRANGSEAIVAEVQKQIDAWKAAK